MGGVGGYFPLQLSERVSFHSFIHPSTHPPTLLLGTHHDVALELHGLGHGVGEVTDGDLVLLPHTQDEGLGGLYGWVGGLSEWK